MAEHRDAPREVDPSTLPLGRAAFLATVAAGLGGIALASRFDRAVGNAVNGVAGAVPALGDLAPGDGWRIYTVADTMPRFDAATYRLRVRGLVERPLDLAWSDVAALPAQREVRDFHCVTGWTVRNVRWTGVSGRSLVDLVRPRPTARFVTFVSLEQPYVDQLSLAQFTAPDVLLAHTMDGKPLPRVHGAPLRLVVPEMYGYKSVKWVGEIVFGSREDDGYWEQRGYDVDAFVGRSNGLG